MTMTKVVNGERIYMTADEESATRSSWEDPLVLAQRAKIAELRESCRAHIFAGFDSDALGTVHHYPAKQDSTHQDQLNLNGLVTKSYEEPTNTFKFWCADSGGAWARREHTAEQIRQVGVDGANHVIAAQDKLAGMTDQANAATTRAELDAITW